MKRVTLRRIAKRDLQDAVEWYRQRDAELADRFLDEVFRVLALIEEYPNVGGPVFGIADATVRQMPVDHFPYQVVFRRTSTRTAVLAIAHERKRPGYWRS